MKRKFFLIISFLFITCTNIFSQQFGKTARLSLVSFKYLTFPKSLFNSYSLRFYDKENKIDDIFDFQHFENFEDPLFFIQFLKKPSKASINKGNFIKKIKEESKNNSLITEHVLKFSPDEIELLYNKLTNDCSFLDYNFDLLKRNSLILTEYYLFYAKNYNTLQKIKNNLSNDSYDSNSSIYTNEMSLFLETTDKQLNKSSLYNADYFKFLNKLNSFQTLDNYYLEKYTNYRSFIKEKTNNFIIYFLTTLFTGLKNEKELSKYHLAENYKTKTNDSSPLTNYQSEVTAKKFHYQPLVIFNKIYSDSIIKNNSFILSKKEFQTKFPLLISIILSSIGLFLTIYQAVCIKYKKIYFPEIYSFSQVYDFFFLFISGVLGVFIIFKNLSYTQHIFDSNLNMFYLFPLNLVAAFLTFFTHKKSKLVQCYFIFAGISAIFPFLFKEWPQPQSIENLLFGITLLFRCLYLSKTFK